MYYAMYMYIYIYIMSILVKRIQPLIIRIKIKSIKIKV